MKRTHFLLTSALLFGCLCCPSFSHAIITDPDDYIVYDTGILADSASAWNFLRNHPGNFIMTPNTTVWHLGPAGRYMKSAEALAKIGYYHVDESTLSYASSGMDVYIDGVVTSFYGLVIPQDNGNVTAPFSVDALKWKKNQAGLTPELKTAFRWYGYNRPSDSLIIRVAQPCDSISIEICGANNVPHDQLQNHPYGENQGVPKYGAIIYQRSNGWDDHYYIGGQWGRMWTMGIKPDYEEGKDSIDLIIQGANRDWYVTQTGGKKHDVLINPHREAYDDGTSIYPHGSGWGTFQGVSINRIKIYGKIDKGEIPPFDGTVWGWTCRYQPKESGTVDLEKPLDNEPSDKRYMKYASDLGIVRVLMTTSQEYGMYVSFDEDCSDYVMTIDAMQADPADSEGSAIKHGNDYEREDFHCNWFQMSGKASGCQEMKLDFDFVIRDGNPIDYPDSIAVAVQKAGDTKWTVLGFNRNVYDAHSEEPVMSHVAYDLPDSIFADGSFNLRILAAYLENSGASMSIANVKVSGFDDWYEKKDNAPVIGYISQATDRIHAQGRATTADSTDALLKRLMRGSDYQVKLFTQKETVSMTDAESVRAAFANCDLVILSAYPDVEQPVVKNIKALVGYKPFLNLNAASCSVLDKGQVSKIPAGDSLAVISPKYMIHPLFNGISLESKGDNLLTPELFQNDRSGEGLLGFEGNVEEGAIGRGISSGTLAIYEDCSCDSAKYLMLAISKDQNNQLTSAANKLIDNALIYLLSDGHFEAPDFNLTTGGAVVNSTSELESALKYDFSVIGVNTPSIRMKPSNDSDGAYHLDEIKSSSQNAFILSAYDNADSVRMTGSLSLSSTSLASIQFDGLYFDGNNQVLTLNGKANLPNGISFINCHFQAVPGIFSASGCDSSYVSSVSVTSCRFERLNGPAVLFIGESSHLTMGSVEWNENVFVDCAPEQWIVWGGYQATSDTVRSVTLNHNVFFFTTDPDAFGFISLKSGTPGVSGRVRLSNNIFCCFGQSALMLDMSMSQSSYIRSTANLFVGQQPEWPEAECQDWTLSDFGLNTLFANGLSLDKTSDLYISGTDRSNLGALSVYAQRTEARKVLVHNVPELKTALEIAIGGDVIELADHDSVYLLGSGGFGYPTTHGTLVVKAAQGAHPKLFGRITTNRSACVDTLIYEGLTWVDSTHFAGFDNEAFNPFLFNASRDTVSGALIIRNCNFLDQQIQVILRTRGSAGSYYGHILMENCRIDNQGGTLSDGETGGHLIQFDASADYSLNHFSFIHNVVSNFHGSQMFNVGRNGSTSSDDYSIHIDGNLFYKVGGNAKSSLRSFLEFGSIPSESSVDISIADNIFYKRWSSNYYPVALLSLFDADTTVVSNIMIANNLYEGKYYTGDESLMANPMAPTNSDENFTLANSKGTIVEEASLVAPVIRCNDLYLSGLGIDHLFADESSLLISRQSPAFTAGGNGAPLGPEYLYGDVDDLKHNSEAARMNLAAWCRDGKVFVRSGEPGVVEIFSLTGQKLYSEFLDREILSVDCLNTDGIYVVRMNGAAVKVAFVK